jgi:hypothetical protein
MNFRPPLTGIAEFHFTSIGSEAEKVSTEVTSWELVGESINEVTVGSD